MGDLGAGVRVHLGETVEAGGATGIRAYNPLGRVPALVLDDGEVLVESSTILDHLDDLVGPDRALVPAGGAPRRAVLHLVALAIGTVEKALK